MRKQKASIQETCDFIVQNIAEDSELIVEELEKIDSQYCLREEDSETATAIASFVLFCYDFSLFSVFKDSKESIEVRQQFKNQTIKLLSISQVKTDSLIRNHSYLLKKHKNHEYKDWINELLSVTFSWQHDKISELFLTVFLDAYNTVQELSKKFRIV